MSTCITYEWAPYVKNRGTPHLREQYFKRKNDSSTDHKARSKMQRIVAEIESHSGLKRSPKDCCIFGVTLGIGIALVFTSAIPAELLAESNPSIGALLTVLMFGLGVGLIIWACCYKCETSGLGAKSGIEKVEKYMSENGPRFVKEMNSVGWSFQWKFVEEEFSKRVKRNGRLGVSCIIMLLGI